MGCGKLFFLREILENISLCVENASYVSYLFSEA